jgi:integrase/recombinase XerD
MEEEIHYFIEYLATQRHCAANTLTAYRIDLLQLYHFICLERPHLSSWARVDSLLLQAFVLHLKASEYSPATVARKVAAIKTFYFYLLEKKQIAGNPTLHLEAPQVLKHTPRTMTEAEVQKLLQAVPTATPKGFRDRAILELLCTAGLRVTELVTLPVGAVDLETKKVRVEGPEGERVLDLGERALEAVRVYLEKGRAALKGPNESGSLFVNARGRQMTRQGIWLIIKGYAKRAEIEGQITPHSLRHTFAAQRLAQGERIEDLQRLLGHANLSTTLMYNRRRGTEG